MVSAEISAAIQQIIVNGAALLACTQQTGKPDPSGSSLERPVLVGDAGGDLKFVGNLGFFYLFKSYLMSSLNIMNGYTVMVLIAHWVAKAGRIRKNP